MLTAIALVACGCGASYSAQHQEALQWTEDLAAQDARVLSAPSSTEALTMERAAALAVARSPEQAVANSALRVSDAELGAAGVTLRPEVRVFALPGVGADPTRYDVALRVRPDHPGEVRARRSAARLRVVAGRYDVDAQREVVATRARITFSEVGHSRRGVALLQEEIRLAGELRDLAHAGRRQGLVTSDDAYARENALADLELELADLRAGLAHAEESLRRQIGFADEAPLRLAEVAPELPESEEQGPLLAAAEARRLAAEREVAAANWQRTPWISFLQVEARVDGQERGRVGFSVGVEIPLFDTGGRQVRVREAEVERLGAEHAAAEQEGADAIAAAGADVRRAAERRRMIAETYLPPARRRAAELQEALSAGAAERASLLQAESRVLSLQRRLVSAEGEYARARLVHRLNRYLYQGTERSSLERTP